MREQHDHPALPDPADGAGEKAAEKDVALPGRPAGETEAVPGRVRPADRRYPGDQPAASVSEQLAARLWRLPAGHPSSPYNGDGTLRPPVPDHRELERPLPGDDGYHEPWHPRQESPPAAVWERPAGSAAGEHARPGANGSRPEAGQGVDSWRNGLQHLQDLWRKHEEKWPESERQPADGTGDEPGSWRGPGGHYLNAEENLVSDHARERVGDVEKKTTPALAGIRDEVPGAELAGLEFRLKGEERFKEKVAGELRAKPERPIGLISENMPDALRYTYQLRHEQYTQDYWSIDRSLAEKGYVLDTRRNSWESQQYKGMNTRWWSPEGQLLEIQFHTAESFQAKQLTHKAYERIRSPLTSDLEREELYHYQAEISSHIPVPAGTPTIPDYRGG